MEKSENKRGSFTGSIGFVLAAAGSAVGLGNLWRFPYLAARYGGGMFLLLYLILAFTFGFTLMVSEISLGRKTGQSSIKAFEKLDKRFSILGIISALVPTIITPYYCVIGGWVLKFLTTYIKYDAAYVASTNAAGLTVFEQLITSPSEPVLWFVLFLSITIAVVMIGVEQGIEKISKILMPILFVLVLFLAIFSCTRPNAIHGLVYYLKPNKKDLSVKTALAAMTQLFYSLSLAMGIMVTYGSYMKKDNNIQKSSHQIIVCDTFVAILAGLIIIPAIFAYSQNIDKALTTAGPSLMFIIVPQIFANMPFGRIIAILFFFLVFFAAITSSISLCEAVVSNIADAFKLKRNVAIAMTFFICIIIGLLASLGYGPLDNVKLLGMQFLDFFDFISNSVLMPIVALFICIFVGYVLKPKAIIDEVQLHGVKFTWKGLFTIVIKYIAPMIIVTILVVSIFQAMGKISI